jgi:peroxiredoxin Q/BCP
MALAPGMPAPDFRVLDQNGQQHKLADYTGERLVLFFYPKDNTPGCTEQACNLRDNINALWKAGLTVLGVSVDSARKHKNFETKFELPFPLLADVEKQMVNDYQIWGEKTFWGKKYLGTFRTTFLINEAGVIDHIIDQVDTANHAAQILELWSNSTGQE